MVEYLVWKVTMTELKTLKEIKQEDIDPKDNYEYNEGQIKISRLRLEAIKWVKELYLFPSPHEIEENEAYEFITGNKLVYSEEGKQAIINFIKYFFGITTEDLK